MKSALWLAIFAFLAPMLVVALARIAVQFPLGKVLLLVFVLVLPIYILVLTAINRFSYQQVEGNVEISAAFLYSARVKESDLRGARIYDDMAKLGELAPALRTNGIGMPGVAIGNFRLRNGQNATLFVKDTNRPVLAVQSPGAQGTVIVNTHLIGDLINE